MSLGLSKPKETFHRSLKCSESNTKESIRIYWNPDCSNSGGVCCSNSLSSPTASQKSRSKRSNSYETKIVHYRNFYLLDKPYGSQDWKAMINSLPTLILQTDAAGYWWGGVYNKGSLVRDRVDSPHQCKITFCSLLCFASVSKRQVQHDCFSIFRHQHNSSIYERNGRDSPGNLKQQHSIALKYVTDAFKILDNMSLHFRSPEHRRGLGVQTQQGHEQLVAGSCCVSPPEVIDNGLPGRSVCRHVKHAAEVVLYLATRHERSQVQCSPSSMEQDERVCFLPFLPNFT